MTLLSMEFTLYQNSIFFISPSIFLFSLLPTLFFPKNLFKLLFVTLPAEMIVLRKKEILLVVFVQ